MPLRQTPPDAWQRSASPPVERAGAGVDAGDDGGVVVAQPEVSSSASAAPTATIYATLDIGDSHDVIDDRHITPASGGDRGAARLSPAYTTHQIVSHPKAPRMSSDRLENEFAG